MMPISADHLTIFGLLLVVFGFLLSGRVRYDLVAFSALILAVLIGVVPVEVAWTPATLRRHPCYVLAWVFDVAGFAVNAVLGIDLESFFIFFINNFIDPSWAIALRRFRPLRKINLQRP